MLKQTIDSGLISVFMGQTLAQPGGSATLRLPFIFRQRDGSAR
jgi:hypothetical protein